VRKLLLTALCLLVSANAFGASTNKYWIGGAGDNFTDDTKWSLSSGGNNDTTTPGATDIANFSGGGNTNCSFSAAVNVGGFKILSGYTQTVTQSTYTLTVGADNFSEADGAFAGGSGSITINGNWTLSGGTFTSTSTTFAISGDFTRSAGTFTHNSGTVNFTGGDTSLTCTDSLKVVTVNKTAHSNTLTLGANLTTAGSITVTTGTLYLAGFDLAYTGTFSIESGAFLRLKGTESSVQIPTLQLDSTVTYVGDDVSSAKTCKNWGYYNLTINDANTNKSSFKFGETHTGIATFRVTDGTFSQSAGDYAITCITYTQTGGTFTGGTAALTVNGAFALSTGTFTSTSGTLTVTGNFTRTSGTFTHNSGTVAITGGSSNFTCTDTLNILTVTKTNGGNTFSLGAALTCGAFTFAQGTMDGNYAVTCSSFAQTNGTVTCDSSTWTVSGAWSLATGTFTAPTGTLNVGGNFTRTSGTFTHNSGTVNFTTGNTSLTCTNSFRVITVNKTAQSNTLTLGAALTTASTNTVTTGKLCLAGFNLTSTGAFTVANGATLCLQGVETVTTPTLNAGSIVEYVGDNVANTKTCKNWAYKNLTFNDVNGNLTTFKFGETHTGIETFTMTAGIFSQSAGDYAITCTGFTQTAGTFTGGSTTLTINGNFSMSNGTFTAGANQSIIIGPGGDWTFSAGTFTAGSSTVTFQGVSGNANVIDSGSMSFNNVILGTYWGQVVTITGTMDINGNLTLNLWQVDTGTITVFGNLTTSTTFASGSATFVLDGTGAQTLGASGGTGYLPGNIIINKGGGTLTIQDTIYVVVTNAGTCWTYTAGTVDAGSSTIIFAGLASQTISSGAMSFNNVTFDFYHGAIMTVSGTMDINGNVVMKRNLGCIINGGTITIAGNLTSTTAGTSGTLAIVLDGTGTQNISVGTNTITSGTFTVNKASGAAVLTANLSVNATGQDLALTSGTLDLAGFNLTVNDSFVVAAAGILQLKGVETVSTPALGDNSTVIYVGDNVANTKTCKSWLYAYLTINDTNTNKSTFKFAETHNLRDFKVKSGTFSQAAGDYVITCEGYIQDGGTFTGGTAAVNVSVGFIFNNGTFTSTSGTLTISGGIFYRASGTFAHNSGTVAFTGNSAGFICTDALNIVTVTRTLGGDLFELGSDLTCGAFTFAQGTLCRNCAVTCSSFAQTGGTVTCEAATWTVSGDWSLATGVFTAPTGTLNISGNFTHTSGTFTHNSGTVALTGTNQQVTGSSTFSTLTKTSGGNTLTFGAGATQTIATALTLQGTVGSYMNLRSTTPGTFTLIQFPATRALKYLDFSDIKNNVAANPVYVQDCRRSGQTYGIIFPGF
jgi:hypothetical protein